MRDHYHQISSIKPVLAGYVTGNFAGNLANDMSYVHTTGVMNEPTAYENRPASISNLVCISY